MRQGYSQSAFTLAELLIALAILGVIATFTIPKILDSGSDAKRIAITKEAISMISQGYQNYKLNSSFTATTTKGVISQYLNYVNLMTNAQIDSYPGDGSYDCTAAFRTCLRLHNGAAIGFGHNLQLGSTDTTSGFTFHIDPDGALSGNEDSVGVFYYTNGRITTHGNRLPNSYQAAFNYGAPNPSDDPAWFSWSN